MTTVEEKRKESAEQFVGKLIGDRYKIVRPLGHGGMGSVHLARDIAPNGQEVAIKILHAEYTDDPVQKQRFLREVELIRRVNHPNVVRLFDMGASDRLFYYVMEFLPGRSLEEIIDRHELPLSQVPNLIVQLSEALAAIHRANIIHRDLKPANIFLDDSGTVKITDFGIARPENSELTKHNEIIGSVLYIAPENWLGRELTSSVDLYSLGIILYEVVTGTLPFEAETAAKVMRLHLDATPIPPRELNSAVPSWLNRLILKLLAKSPLDRPRSAEEVVDEVRSRVDSAVRDDDSKLDEGSATFLQSLEAQWSSAIQPLPGKCESRPAVEPAVDRGGPPPAGGSWKERLLGPWKRR